MNKQKIRELWNSFTGGDNQDVEFFNNHFGWGRRATIEDRLLFTENRLLNLTVYMNKIVDEITKTEDLVEDPCPACMRGAVCRTPACGRLKLDPDHPLRKRQ